MAATEKIGPVHLQLPPDPQLLRVARLAASALASIGGFDVDLIDDVKLAVSEALLALIELGSGGPIRATFALDDGAFVVTAASTTERSDLRDAGLELCRTVLAGVTASHDVRLDGTEVVITATLRDLAG